VNPGLPASLPARPSTWAPLKHPVFRGIWLAGLVSQTGSFMTDVAQGWLMTTLAASPLTVALLTTAESLPIFLLSLPAGAVADIMDRRRLLIVAQTAMALIAACLVVTTRWESPRRETTRRG
jgi:MFS family permease